MSTPSRRSEFSAILNGNSVNVPVEWRDLEILATFDNDSVQANITSSQLTFVNQAYRDIMNWFNGQFGAFEGMPFSLLLQNIDNNYTAFDGYLDLVDGFQWREDAPILKSGIKKLGGLNSIQDKLQALSFGFLEDEGFINNSHYIDVEYVAEKKINTLELIISLITLYLMTRELIVAINRIAKTAADLVAHTTGGVIGPAAGVIYGIVVGVLEIAFAALILVAVIKLGRDIVDTLIPPKRTGKGAKLGVLMRRVCQYLGYNLSTDIAELDTYVFFQSNQNLDQEDLFTGFIDRPKSPEKGIPNPTDAGYNCLQFFEIVKDMFNGKYAVIGNDIHFRNIDSNFWFQNSTFVKKNLLKGFIETNASDFSANWIMNFTTDVSDEWTIDNYKGTTYEVITDSKSSPDPKKKLLKGLEEINLPWALGNRKDSLNGFERSLKNTLAFFDNVANFFGGNSDLASNITNKVGLLKISTNQWAVPKVIYLRNNRLPQNHRDLLSAKYLENKYYAGRSFVRGGGAGQRLVINGESVPMDLGQFISVINNGKCFDENGTKIEFTSVKFKPFLHQAEIDYKIKKKYTDNLKEINIEPS